MVGTYKKKPEYVMAVQFAGDNVTEIDDFMLDMAKQLGFLGVYHDWLEDHMGLLVYVGGTGLATRVGVGDYIVASSSEKFQVYRPARFKTLFNPA